MLDLWSYALGAAFGGSVAALVLTHQHMRKLRALAVENTVDFGIMVVLLNGPLAQPAINSLLEQFLGKDAPYALVTQRLHAMQDAGLLKADVYSGISVYRWHNYQAPTHQP